VLFIGDAQGLIGREMFAIDGVKLPGNASTAKSGTRAEFAQRAAKLEAAAQAMLTRHRDNDARAAAPDVAAQEAQRIERLARDAAQIRRWLTENPADRRGAKGTVRKSNRTDNDSAKMATVKGVIQGYTGKAASENKAARYRPADFQFDPRARTCDCPAGKRLCRHGSGCVINGYAVIRFQGAGRDCVPCAQRSRCLRTPEKTKTRQVEFCLGKAKSTAASYTERMKDKIDSDAGRARYGRRFATVEPVFGNLRHNKRLNRFTLRGRTHVDTQWKLYCLVHNIEKLAHHGYAQ
jgi:hypothetical protein